MSLRDDIWARQYALHDGETVDDGFRRVARAVAQGDTNLEQQFYDMMADNLFIPGGRILAGAGTEHGNVLNCFVQDAGPYRPGSTFGCLHLAKKLAIVTKVGGGNGLNLDPIPAKRPYIGHVGRAYVSIRSDHPDYEQVRTGTYFDQVTGQHIAQGYHSVEFLERQEIHDEYFGAHIIEVPDTIEGIWDAATDMVDAILQGRDCVVLLGALRPEGAPVKGSGGTSSGPASFAVEIFDNFARWAKLGGAEYAGPVATLRYIYATTLRSIRQGGVRRGAGMATMSVTHPDIRDFLTAKDLDRELAEGKIDTFNISVLVTDTFMELANDYTRAYRNRSSTTPEAAEANSLLGLIAKHAWATGEPGIMFIDTVNTFNPLAKVDGPIMASNPCGEIGLYPGEPCDLGALNLAAHMDKVGGKWRVNYPKLGATAGLATEFLDRVLDIEKAPTPEIAKAILDKRRIGLGVMGLADMLIKLGVEYGSPESLELVAEVIGLIRDEAIMTSEHMGRERGIPEGCKRAGLNRRNIALLTVAPTGTTSMLAGVSSGIEPVFAASYTRRIGTDYVRVLHPLLEELLLEHTEGDIEAWGGDFSGVIVDIDMGHGTLKHFLANLPKDSTVLDDSRIKAFITSHEIKPLAHVTMQALVQRTFDTKEDDGLYQPTWAGNQISKTINLPNSATVDDVINAYAAAHKLNAKGITVYRDGSRDLQVLTTGGEEEEPEDTSLEEVQFEMDQEALSPSGDDFMEWLADLTGNPVVSGELKLEGLDTIDDHYSLWSLFHDAVVESGWCSSEEFIEEFGLTVKMAYDAYIENRDAAFTKALNEVAEYDEDGTPITHLDLAVGSMSPYLTPTTELTTVNRPKPRAQGASYKHDVMGAKHYFQVFTNDEGQVVEVWTPAPRGATSAEKTTHELIGRLASLALKHGVDPFELSSVFDGHYDETGGMVQGYGYAKSKWDLLAEDIRTEQNQPRQRKFTTDELIEIHDGVQMRTEFEVPTPESELAKMVIAMRNTPAKKPTDECPDCGSQMVREEGCIKCPTCGYSRCG